MGAVVHVCRKGLGGRSGSGLARDGMCACVRGSFFFFLTYFILLGDRSVSD